MKIKFKKAIAMFSYDNDANAMYVDLSTYYKDKTNRKTIEIEEPNTINLDLNENNEVVGIEILLNPTVEFTPPQEADWP